MTDEPDLPEVPDITRRVERLDPQPMMTRDDLQRTPRHLQAVCALLLDHGINPYDVPADRGDTFTEAGYLAAVGADLTAGRIITERRPWPDDLTLAQVSAALDDA